MRVTDPFCSLQRVRRLAEWLLGRVARITIALSLVVAMVGVSSALARADGFAAVRIPSCAVDLDHSGDDHSGTVSALEHATHLAGHLTFIVDAAGLDVATIDATSTRKQVPTDLQPRSTIPPFPSEPPRT